ncbi:hypothetical protein QBC40DRAFT_284365 [Triangularia verruculosa]|uniref:DnaJ homologue subfamily C member 28 conserved domain-containing protein n=1 Tax=Triangularia verruculosa TaxID=2587418 RepID=A0AAN7AT47_9PEZI|nr:hypothetical protein QBC40DRAFT_284365 [Triangularia verruculosa]
MSSEPFICGPCLRAMRRALKPRIRRVPTRRNLSRSSPALTAKPGPLNSTTSPSTSSPSANAEKEPGPLARRLQEATEEALLEGGRAGRRAVLEDAGFSEELKAKLLSKLADANFQGEHSAAASVLAHSKLPDSSSLGTRSIATAQPWTGTESTEDAVLRMLNDAHKPLAPGLRGKSKIIPEPVDMRFKTKPMLSAGQKAADARDKASLYTSLSANKQKDIGLTEAEREAMKREFRERFTPGARAMPNTMTGLAALANERIENAIARGQFKHIPRGKGVERDTRADNPFIDTTEYIMNKMIKRQDLVPPWIEKQQELLKTAASFRLTIRTNWKRHVARMISAKGGSLEDKMRRASEYARAEEVYNPKRKRKVEEISVSTNSTDDPVMVKIRQQVASDATPATEQTIEQTEENTPVGRPFRDPAWEAAERSYMELAIANLNTITRSYNLMAPELAKKPYFSLERELNSCFADAAPQVSEEIKAKATSPAKSLADYHFLGSGKPIERKGLRGTFGVGEQTRVWERQEPKYGFKELWKDLFKKDK